MRTKVADHNQPCQCAKCQAAQTSSFATEPALPVLAMELAGSDHEAVFAIEPFAGFAPGANGVGLGNEVADEEAEVGRRWQLPRRASQATRRTPPRPLRRRPQRRWPPRRRGSGSFGVAPTVIEASPVDGQGSEYVRWVQHTLNQILDLPLPVDGVMGRETRSAIRSFQQQQGLPVDGIVGPDTERALLAARSGNRPTTDDAAPAQEFEFGWEAEVKPGSPDYTRWVQQALNQRLGLRLAVDGKMGPATRSAIRDFQRKNGLTADGIVGPQTEAALKAAPGRRSPLTSSTEPCEMLSGFDFDRDQLKPAHQRQLDRIAKRIIGSQQTAQPIRALRIVGHTDPVGTDTYNLALGQRRAARVAAALRTTLRRMKRGSERTITLTVESRGEREARSTNAAQNRRVQICYPRATPAVCVIGPSQLTEAELSRSAPVVRRIQPPPFTRPCCILAPRQGMGSNDPNFLEPGALGKHNGVDEANGLIYCGKAGFIDLGHIRDMIDFTKLAHDQLTQGVTPDKVVIMAKTFTGATIVMGEAVMHKCPVSPLDVARNIAYDVGLGHEIVSYTTMQPGGHNSSFSPEDLCSNFLGTLIAERAIKAGGNFDSVVTAELNKLVQALDGQSKKETRRAFDRINGRWVNWSDTRGLLSLTDGYLKRRNFERTPFFTGHPSDAAPPAYVVEPLKDLRSIYSYTHKEGGGNLKRSDYTTEIEAIKRDAQRRYGPNFDKP